MKAGRKKGLTKLKDAPKWSGISMAEGKTDHAFWSPGLADWPQSA